MKKKLLLVFLFAFILRFFLIPTAYHGDLNNNISWGDKALEIGFKDYYEAKNWAYSEPNQPPLYILLFSITSFLYKTIHDLTFYLNNNLGLFPSSFVWFWKDWGMIYLVKLPSILSDVGIAFVIYKIVKKQWIAALWLFNPLTFYNSAIWGQTDPIVNLLGLISIYFLLNKHLILTCLFFITGILFKPSLLIFSPLIFVILLNQKHHIVNWLANIQYIAIYVFFVCITFHPYLDFPIWLFNLYTQRFLPGEIGFLTANAFNLWYLVDPGKVLDSTLYFGIPARIWGIGIFISFYLLIARFFKKNIFYALALIALTSFLFMTRIHERYLYPFFPVATILVGMQSAFLIPYIILSAVFLLNMYNLFWAPSIPFMEVTMQTTQLPVILTVINLLILGVFLFLPKIRNIKL